MRPTRTRMIVVACGGMGVMNMNVTEEILGAKPIDTRPYHVRNNQAPRRWKRR